MNLPLPRSQYGKGFFNNYDKIFRSQGELDQNVSEEPASEALEDKSEEKKDD